MSYLSFPNQCLPRVTYYINTNIHEENTYGLSAAAIAGVLQKKVTIKG